VSWDRNKPLNIDGCSYVIFYYKMGLGENTSVPCTSTSKIITNLEGNMNYQFQVAIRNETGLEAYTGPRSVTIPIMIHGTEAVTDYSTEATSSEVTEAQSGGNYISYS
jgi:hypothetical protein